MAGRDTAISVYSDTEFLSPTFTQIMSEKRDLLIEILTNEEDFSQIPQQETSQILLASNHFNLTHSLFGSKGDKKDFQISRPVETLRFIPEPDLMVLLGRN